MSPLLLYSGLVWPNLNCPHCGKPYVAQPLRSRASASTSPHPMGFLPQPMACAIGFHMAITTGERTKLSVLASRSLPVLARDCAFACLINAADAGLSKCACCCPESTASISSPEPMGVALIKMRRPLAVLCPAPLKGPVTERIQFSFSEL